MTLEAWPGPWCAPHDVCETCGHVWTPSERGDPTFRGSACDLGECVCSMCEAGDECPRHAGE